MNHPDSETLTAWVHDALDSAEAGGIGDHLRDCGDCRLLEEELRRESEMLSEEIASPGRLDSLKASLLHAARTGIERRTPVRGWFWQTPAAAAAMAIFAFLLLVPPRSTHGLTAGRVALDTGQELEAPALLDATKTVVVRAVTVSTLQLRDRSEVRIHPGTVLRLTPAGGRGITPILQEGKAEVRVSSSTEYLVLQSSAGSVSGGEGCLSLRVVGSEGGAMKTSGVVVAVMSGIFSLGGIDGTAEAGAGARVLMPACGGPLLSCGSSDELQDALRRLEELSVAIASLEKEIVKLEEENRWLQACLAAGDISPLYDLRAQTFHALTEDGKMILGGKVMVEEEK